MGAKNSKGVKLLRGDAATPTNFAEVAGVTNINGPGISVNFSNVTTLNDQWDKFIATTSTLGEVTATINYDNTDQSHVDFIDDCKNADGDATLRYYRVQHPNGFYHQFQAMAGGFQPVASTGSQVTANISIKPSGGPS